MRLTTRIHEAAERRTQERNLRVGIFADTMRTGSTAEKLEAIWAYDRRLLPILGPFMSEGSEFRSKTAILESVTFDEDQPMQVRMAALRAVSDFNLSLAHRIAYSGEIMDEGLVAKAKSIWINENLGNYWPGA